MLNISGIAVIDSDNSECETSIKIVKERGKVSALAKLVHGNVHKCYDFILAYNYKMLFYFLTQ